MVPCLFWFFGLVVGSLEVGSKTSRSVSLALRLSSNLLAGHTLVLLISSFVPLVMFLVPLLSLDSLVVVVQCLVLLLLSSVYLGS